MKKLSYLMILTLLASPFVFGQPGDGPGSTPGARFFEMHDADGDGQVTMEEFLVKARTHFEQMDENGDVVITDADFANRRFKMVASHMVMKADSDESGTVTGQEWTAFVETLEVNENGVIDPSQFHQRRRGMGRGGHGPCPASGTLDLNENEALDRDDLTQVFDTLDANDDQIIGEDELAQPGRGHSCRDGFGRGKHGSGHGRRHGKH